MAKAARATHPHTAHPLTSPDFPPTPHPHPLQTNKQSIKVRVDDYFADAPAGTTLWFYLGAEPEGAAEPGAVRCFLAEKDLTEIERTARSSMYFIKNVDGTIPASGISEAVDFGVLCGTTLSNLHDLFREVYTPALVDTGASSGGGLGGGDDASAEAVGAHQDHGFSKFSSQLTQTLQQVDGDLQLTIPDVAVGNVDVAVQDLELIDELEGALEEWTKVIASVVEHEGRKEVQGDGPLAEIEFWRDRNAALSSLFEQIRMPHVQQIIKVLEHVEPRGTFQYHFSVLTKLCVEAKDNVKFLTTLERHFKNIKSGKLSSIQETIPPMMNAIRMVRSRKARADGGGRATGNGWRWLL